MKTNKLKEPAKQVEDITRATLAECWSDRRNCKAKAN